MTTVVVDEAWARRVSREPWAARAVRKSSSVPGSEVLNREVTSGKYEDTRAGQEAAAEYLSHTHASRISEAVSYVEQGAGVLETMLGEAAKRPQGLPVLDEGPRGRVPTPGDQVTGTGSLPRGGYAGQRPETAGTAHVRIDRGIARIDPAEARRLVDAMEPLKRAIIKDSVDAFREALAAKKLEGLPENSAANATIQDLISVCLKAARAIVDRRVADVAAGRFRQKV